LARTRSFRKVLETPETVTQLAVVGDMADIIVEPHDEDTIILHGFILGGDPPLIDVSEGERQIDITIKRARAESRLYSLKMKMFVPIERITEMLSITLEIGDVRIDGVPVKILKIDTSNGDVMVGGVNAEQAKLSCRNGDVMFRGGSFKNGYFTTINGDVRLEILMDRGYSLYASSKRGRIRISLPVNTSAKIRARALRGRVMITPKSAIKEDEGEEVRTIVFGDGDAEIRLETLDGDITINLFATPPVETE